MLKTIAVATVYGAFLLMFFESKKKKEV